MTERDNGPWTEEWIEVECSDCGGYFEFTGVDEEGRDCYFDCDTAECCACGRERQIGVNDDGHAYAMDPVESETHRG